MKNNKTADKIYEYIVDFVNNNGYIPSTRELCKHFNIASTSTIAYYLGKLEEQGKIKRSGNRNRAIEILDRKPKVLTSIENDDFVSIPLVGQIAAGVPILAEQNVEDNFSLPTNLFRGVDLFMLNVRGDSMIEVGINDGDMIIVKKQNTAENGEIVAAMWNDEATVKRFYKENGHIRLQPENSTMAPIILPDVTILGKVIGLIRKI